jgi:hypothetical protein
MGKKFELKTDYSGLKHLFEQPTLNARQTRWLKFLNTCDFDINHIKGKENKVVDTLSKRANEMHATTISVYNSYLKRRILEVVASYHHMCKLKKSYSRVMYR